MICFKHSPEQMYNLLCPYRLIFVAQNNIAVTVSKLCFLMALYEQNNFTLKSAIVKNVSMVGIPGTLYRLECTFQVYSYFLDFFFYPLASAVIHI